MESFKENQSQIIVEHLHDFCEEVIRHNSQFHQHRYYSIYWIQEGEAEHCTTFASTPIQASGMFFIPPRLMHRMKLEKGCRGTGILFEPAVLSVDNLAIVQSNLFTSDIFSVLKLEEKETNNFQFYSNALQKELNEGEQFNRQAVSNLLGMFLIEAHRLFLKQNISQQKEQIENIGQLLEFKTLIDNHFTKVKDVSWYANRLNIRAACLNDLTKQCTGQTAGELIRGRVINEAKRLLVSTNNSGKSIAYQLGFSDPAYFSRFFKRDTGRTLKEYREASNEMYHNSVV